MMRRGLTICRMAIVLAILIGAGALRAQDVSGEITIMIASPGEGEIFYAAPERFKLSMPITGQVFGRDMHLDPSTVEIHLELIAASGARSTATVRPDDAGYFTARASMLEPNLPIPSNDAHLDEFCGVCHRSDVELVLPDDVTHLVVTARAADGRTGQETRTLRFDRSSFLPLNVTVEGLPDGHAPAQVSATTMVYNWRRRTYLEPVEHNLAAVSIERLNHAELVYTVELVPLVLDGVLYTTAAQEVVVRPAVGEQDPPLAVTLVASPTRGTISGRVIDAVTREAVAGSVLAIDARTGAAQTSTADAEGRFAFADLPVAGHLLLVRSPTGFHLPQHIDLVDQPDSQTTVRLTPAGESTLRGRVLLSGAPLPFAQVTVSGLPSAHVDPLTGVFELDGVPADGTLAVEIAAAGCYGLRLTTDHSDLGDITLSLRPDTQVIARDGWTLYVPAATRLAERDGDFVLEGGVVWSWGGATDAALRVGSFSLQGDGAGFAVEKAGASLPRIYVAEGEVLVSQVEQGEPIRVATGQTMVLDGAHPLPVTLLDGVGPLLRAEAGSVSPFLAAPAPEVIRAQAVNAALVTVAQGFMLAAYGLTFVVAPALLVVGAVMIVYHRRRRPATR